MNFKIRSKRFIRNEYKFDSYYGLLPEFLEKKRVNFIPEIKPELLKYDKKIWKRMFPQKPGVKMEKYKMTNIGKYSMIYPNDAQRIAKIIKSFFPSNQKLTVTDATANMGGITLGLSDHFDEVHAVEIVPFHCDILRNNIKNYAPNKNITVHCDDYLNIADKINQDAIFFDPPWGGRDYNTKKCLQLYLDDISIVDIAKELLKKVDIVAIRIPCNYHFSELLALTKKSYIYRFINPTLKKLNFFMVILSKKDYDPSITFKCWK